MSSRKRRQEMRAAKTRRQKQIAIGGAVLLAILLAVQVPRLMNRGGSSTAATATTTTAGSETTTSTLSDGTDAAPATSTAVGSTAAGTGAAAGAAPTHTTLPDSDAPPTRLRTQLASFELFDSKDPFVQQVTDAPPPTVAAGTPAPGQPAAGAATGSGTTAMPPGTPASATTAATTPPQVTARTLAHSLNSQIEVNGKTEQVGVGQDFPASSPTFKLVSLGNGAAMIGIARGAYASGAQTVALQLGKTLTLVDTTDGVRYQLRLVSTS